MLMDYEHFAIFYQYDVVIAQNGTIKREQLL